MNESWPAGCCLHSNLQNIQNSVKNAKKRYKGKLTAKTFLMTWSWNSIKVFSYEKFKASCKPWLLFKNACKKWCKNDKCLKIQVMDQVAELGNEAFLQLFSCCRISVIKVKASLLDKCLVFRLLICPLTSVLMGAKLDLPKKSETVKHMMEFEF